MQRKPCPCGSGLPRRDLTDAAGIFCAYVCDACEAERRKRYDPAIFESGTRYARTGEEADIGESDTPSLYWIGSVETLDDFGRLITNEFIDGATSMGPWAIMSIDSWRRHGVGNLGTGFGQRYRKQADGRWLKVEG